MQEAEAELEKLSYIEHRTGRGPVWRPRYCKKCQACGWCTCFLHISQLGYFQEAMLADRVLLTVACPAAETTCLSASGCTGI